jgi:Mn-dependent DtxR family transcriptional regulator
MTTHNLKHNIRGAQSQKAKGLENKSSRRKTDKITSRLEVIRDVHSAKMNDRATYRMEDYLEAIYELIQHKGYATSIDIAECLNVSQPSVTTMMQRLDRSELIDYEKYRGVRLTERGIDIATAIHERHGVVLEFLKMIGVNEDIANRDSEEIEHHMHPETLRSLRELMERIKAG